MHATNMALVLTRYFIISYIPQLQATAATINSK